MKNNKLLTLLIMCLICVLTLLCVKRLLLYHPKDKVRTEIKYERDTIVLRDTIVIEKPVPLTTIRYKDRIIRDTVYVNSEPILADMPIEEKIYADERYEAIVSGFHPTLEKLEIYTKDTIINNIITETKTIKKKPSWSIGLQIGYGVDKDLHSTPYLGIGITKNIFSW